MTFRFLLLSLLAFSLPASAALRAGAAALDITPLEWPVQVIGNFGLTLSSQAHDPLMARAVVFDDGKGPVAIVVIDSCFVKRPVLDAAKRMAQERTGIPADRMLMSATHMHSGPPAYPLQPTDKEGRYTAYLTRQIAEAVTLAHARLEPAEVGWAVREIPEELNNRRWFLKEGTMSMNPFGGKDDKVRMNPGAGSPDLVKPAGPIDPQFWIVSVRSTSGQPIALLGNYSLHYVGGVPGPELSADYFGEFARTMEQKLAPGNPKFVAMLSNGTSGDVNNTNFVTPRPRKAPYERIREVAGRLASEAETALKTVTYQRDVPLGAAQRELPLRYRKPTPEELDRARRFVDEPDESKLPPRAKPYAERAIRLHNGPDYADVLLQVLRIGNLGIAAIPCEVFTQIGLDIKARSPFKPTFTIELANGHYGYLPTPEQHLLGGYETWLGTNNLEKQASVKITDTLMELFATLAPPARRR